MNDTDNDGEQSAEALLTELKTLCKSKSLSEEGLRELFERHGWTSNKNNNTLTSNYGFFLVACYNERITEGIIQLLLEYFPDAVRANDSGFSPLHCACRNKSVTRGIIQLLIDAAPDSGGSVTNKGNKPLHCLCANGSINETDAVQSLKFLIEKYPEAVRHADNNKGRLPIHIAVQVKSPEFCRVLIKAYPGSERISDSNGVLALHYACAHNNVATVECLYKLYPDAINHEAIKGYYPIHGAILGLRMRANTESAIETVQYLLDCDSNVIFQKFQGTSLLHSACRGNYNDSNIDAAMGVVKTIYDARPEAIEDNIIALGIKHWHPQVNAFINSEMVYTSQAKDHRLMMTPDSNGRLPLHRALQDNVRLGSIKVLVKGNPSAIQCFDNGGAIPLHIACQHHDSASVVGYMISLANITLDATDRQGNTALHYACRGAKYDTIALLLEKYDAVSVSKRNVQKKLPIDLLWESNAVEDRESVEYMDCIFRLLKAYPETVMTVWPESQRKWKEEKAWK